MNKKVLFIVFIVFSYGWAGAQISRSTVEKTYNQLLGAIGSQGKIPPAISTSRSTTYVAYYSPSSNTIFVEEKFLSICAQFGADSVKALSFILGHELAHFFRNHAWLTSEGIGYVAAEMKDDWKVLGEENHAKDETEADIFSGFYNLVAGMEVMDIAPQVLKKVYEAYGLSEELDGYPSLSQRMQIAGNAKAKAYEMFVLFQTGTLALIAGQYSPAKSVFSHLYNSNYTGVEILNNLALCYLFEGQSLLGDDRMYFYPLMLDMDTKLDGTRGDDQKAKAKELIELAVKYLREAEFKDPKYLPARINLAAAALMLNDFIEADYQIKKGLAQAPNNPNLKCMQGIYHAMQGDNTMAIGIWRDLQSELDAAKWNISVAEGKKVEPIISRNSEMQSVEPVDNIDLSMPWNSRENRLTRIRIAGATVSYFDMSGSQYVEIRGEGNMGLKLQLFSTDLESFKNIGWDPTYQLADGNVYQGKGYMVYKIERKNRKPLFVKYFAY